MRLTVLGMFGPFPSAGGACSGYLVESGSTKLMVDCGSGTVAKLFALCPLPELSGIAVSHLHMDHASDLGVLRYALEAAGRAIPLIAPDAPKDASALLTEHAVFEKQVSEAGKTYRIGDLCVTLYPVHHPVPTYAMRISDGEKTLFYTGDTGDFEGLSDLARGADAMLADVCFTEEEAKVKPPVHLTRAQARRIAKEAGVTKLWFTHQFGGRPLEAADELVVPMISYDI